MLVKNVTQSKSVISINVIVNANIWETSCVRKKYVWNPSTCTSKNGKYWASIITDSVITCNGIIEVKKTAPTKTALTETIPAKTTPIKATSTKTVPTNFNKKEVNYKMKNEQNMWRNQYKKSLILVFRWHNKYQKS